MGPQLDKKLTVTICGGGNGAHVAAGYLGSKPHVTVNVLTRRPADWSHTIVISTEGSSWSNKGSTKGELNIVTDDPSQIIPASDVVLVACPANTHLPILQKIAPFLKDNCFLGSLYCQGGFDWAVSATVKDLSKLKAFFGLQNIPWICKAFEYGHQARIIGPKKQLYLACCKPDKSPEVSSLLESFFDIPCVSVPNFLSLTLTPSNQIIHPARYYGIFHTWDGHKTYKKDEIQWGLYTEMDDLSEEWLIKLDKELQSIKVELERLYPQLDLSAVLPIKDRIIKQYGDDIKDTSSLKTTFRTNLGYAGCVTPVKAMPDGSGFIPAVESRLFWEDIPYGLCILKSIAEMLHLQTPSIDFMIKWHQQYMNKNYLLDDHNLNKELTDEMGTPEHYGITSLDQLVAASLTPQNIRAKL